MARRVRSDAFVEETEYRDTGCSLAPSCLRCPFSRCRYDPGSWAERLSERDARLVLFAASHRVDETAAKFGISRRSVFRIVAGARAGGSPGTGALTRAANSTPSRSERSSTRARPPTS